MQSKSHIIVFEMGGGKRCWFAFCGTCQKLQINGLFYSLVQVPFAGVRVSSPEIVNVFPDFGDKNRLLYICIGV